GRAREQRRLDGDVVQRRRSEAQLHGRRAGAYLHAAGQMTGQKDRARLHLGVAAALAIAMIVFCALRLRVTTDITHFLPAVTDHELAELSRRLADSALTRTLILDVGGADPAAVREGAAALATGLASNPEIAWMER